jgi:uncharacterized protein with HEPN domain
VSTVLVAIQSYLEDCDQLAFSSSTLIQDAVIRNFEIIGEASKNIERLYPDFIKTHSDIPFIDAYEMRNALSHGYFKVDLDILWKTIQVNLPDLKIQIDQLVNR